jgi:hypothetical protein
MRNKVQHYENAQVQFNETFRNVDNLGFIVDEGSNPMPSTK